MTRIPGMFIAPRAVDRTEHGDQREVRRYREDPADRERRVQQELARIRSDPRWRVGTGQREPAIRCRRQRARDGPAG